MTWFSIATWSVIAHFKALIIIKHLTKSRRSTVLVRIRSSGTEWIKSPNENEIGHKRRVYWPMMWFNFFPRVFTFSPPSPPLIPSLSLTLPFPPFLDPPGKWGTRAPQAPSWLRQCLDFPPHVYPIFKKNNTVFCSMCILYVHYPRPRMALRFACSAILIRVRGMRRGNQAHANQPRMILLIATALHIDLSFHFNTRKDLHVYSSFWSSSS